MYFITKKIVLSYLSNLNYESQYTRSKDIESFTLNWEMGPKMKRNRPEHLNQRGLWLIAVLKPIDIIQLVTLSHRSSSPHCVNCVQCVNCVEKSHITQIRTILGSSVFYISLVCLFVDLKRLIAVKVI